MPELQELVIDIQQKVVDHYRSLLNSSTSEPERERYRCRIQEHEQELRRLLNERSTSRRAA